MKIKTLSLAVASAMALMAGSLQAQQVTNDITVSFTATEQDTNITTNAESIVTAPAPKVHSVTTSTILGWLAIDTTNTFSPGSKLVVVHDGDLQVLDKHNNFLADVSGILSILDSGVYGAEVYSGKQNATNYLAEPETTDQEVFSIKYDDSANTNGVNVQFSFAGVIKNTTTDTKPNAAGNYKETQTHTMSGAQGDGMYKGTPFVITGGSLHASGSGELSITNEVD